MTERLAIAFALLTTAAVGQAPGDTMRLDLDQVPFRVESSVSDAVPNFLRIRYRTEIRMMERPRPVSTGPMKLTRAQKRFLEAQWHRVLQQMEARVEECKTRMKALRKTELARANDLQRTRVSEEERRKNAKAFKRELARCDTYRNMVY
jgi:hypothetical protein